MMNTPTESILLVENDPDISDLIAHQALEPLGYEVQVAVDVNAAIQCAARSVPDLVIADLNLPGLNGKDLLVALHSQGLQVPVIVIAEKGQENNVIQAFRLGGTDYLLWPTRETEVVAVVERAIKQVRESRSRESLDLQLKETNQELQRRLHELTIIYTIGKAVVSITDQQVLFDKIVEGMVYLAEADYGWLLLREDHSRTYVLASHRNLPTAWAKKMGQPLDDGVSNLVALAGETLAMNGEPLKRFKISTLGNSVLVVPVKIHWEVIGLLVVVRKIHRDFEKNVRSLLETVAYYTSVSLVNARLSRALQEAAESAMTGEKLKLEQLHVLGKEIQSLIQPLTHPIDLLLAGKMGDLTDEQKQAFTSIQVALLRTLQLVSTEQPSKPHDSPGDISG